MFRVRSFVALLPAFGLLSGCPRKQADPNQKPPAPNAAPSAAASGTSTASPVAEPLPNERVEIPGGSFRVGSRPGDPGRNPELEPRLTSIELGPFQIDRLPFPNDGKSPPLTGVSRDDAKRHCAERGERLCTELEWERACKGPASNDYATGKSWEARCANEPLRCASGFDVLSMGGNLREWVASEVPSKDGVGARALLRGAPANAPGQDHRCAARRTLDGQTKADDLGFRCCKGAPNAAIVPEPKLGDTFSKAKIGVEALEAVFKRDPHTANISGLKFYREPDAANTVVSRGPGDKKGFSFTVAPLIWRPVAGAEFLLVSGKAGDADAFVAVLHVLGDDEYAVAASFFMKNEPGPVAFAYSDSIRPRVHWSTCWGCPGETGKILFRPPESVVIFQP
ncbi:MAG TPA: SUMF1/EgtB/PvdO family nonheme iron enzyme [Polyangiaceae bacterium]|nr:SUMF1/EgtB/PvdO family nonheme iron enzyme [Polyangiaceae bacterium]